ncbi:MAG: hypothetical protein APR53_03315 [Methanoculleus sp. SDB]|nr:MAG: hypothetical protein APR53_03315 [Methanoculleus sp. SDB]
MDIVIFCGGRGTRLSEKTREMPKPLVELGEYPILWHIMKIYAHYNYKKFILTLGYRGDMIVNYFLNQHPLTQNFSINLSDISVPQAKVDWEIFFIQTGQESKTSKRLALCRQSLRPGTFMVTYGDGVADIDIDSLLLRHEKLRAEHGIIATITITRPYSKYGIAKLNGDIIDSFREKPRMDEFINVGFMVLEEEVFDYISENDDVMFEDTLQVIAGEGKLGYYVHDGFWHPMDTYKDYEELNQMWQVDPRWKIWND